MLEKFFKLKENGTDVKTEVIGGVTTFMAMAYILAVNPSILSASGMDAQAILIATALASFVGTMCMALMANYPFALFMAVCIICCICRRYYFRNTLSHKCQRSNF